MTKRYGRNQKRRARAQAEALQADVQAARQALTLEQALVGKMRARIDRQEKQLQDCARVLGVAFIGLEPAVYAIENRTHAQQFRALTVDGTRIELAHMTARVFTDSHPTRMLHFSLLLGDGQCSYTITEEALRYAPPEIVIENLSRQMARQFVEGYRAEKARAVG